MRTTSTSIAFSLSIVSAAQLSLGPSARYTWVDAPRKVKIGYGLQISKPLNDRVRLNLEGYWTPWEDVHYFLDYSSGFGQGPTRDIRFEHQHWGLNLDLERSTGTRGWFVAAGLGYSSFYKSRMEITTSSGASDTSYQEFWDRLLALNVGLGKRWKIGPGDLRAALTAGALGYNFDHPAQRIPLLETYGFSLSYRIRLGKKR